jgi:kinase suppressor of Ras 2
VFGTSPSSLPRSDTYEMVALTLGDFRIKHRELQFGRVMVGRRPGRQIHQGRWHGDVVIHSCSPQDDRDVQTWLAEVRALANIRQENLVLYMGACVEPPSFAIITSPVKADSLHTHTIIRGHRLPTAGKLALLRQTADALSYLHAKGITHGRLSAHNIFLEAKVKVSLLDYAPASLNLEYYSPEIARALDALQPCRPPSRSTEGDVFAFGTLVYQLGTERAPLPGLPAHARLWLAGTGGLAALLARETGSSLGRLAALCWATEPAQRPAFPRLCSLLHPTACPRREKKLSTSEPRSLDQLGRAGGSGLLS